MIVPSSIDGLVNELTEDQIADEYAQAGLGRGYGLVCARMMKRRGYFAQMTVELRAANERLDGRRTADTGPAVEMSTGDPS